jgi:benzoyl-CoA 2,3-dioxygenase component B
MRDIEIKGARVHNLKNITVTIPRNSFTVITGLSGSGKSSLAFDTLYSKFQLKSLAESAFDPLSRTCRFMLTEEAHHMFVGETGLARVVKRTLEVMNELGTDDPVKIRTAGAVDLPLLQKYLNFWCSSSLDLFGSEVSSNSAANFANGLKGRPDESQYEDHVLREAQFKLATPKGAEDVPMLNALNEVMRESYLKDCEIGFKRWNRLIERAGFALRLSLPSTHFRRSIGAWVDAPVTPEGKMIAREEYDKRLYEWIPSEADRAFVRSLMQRVVEPGKMAGWIGAPDRGINNLPVEYEYVKLS